MPRAMWSGAISFGLVNIPIKLFTAVSRKSVHFNQIDARSGARIRYQKVSDVDAEPVPAEQIVKGYELPSGEYVTVGDDELAALDPEASRTIEIEQFIDLDEIDPLFYDAAYYVAPDKATLKPYALLVQAMEESGKVAIARFVMRSKQYLCAIRPKDGALVLSTMVYPDEINAPADIPEIEGAAQVELSAKERKMAAQLVASLSEPFEPEAFEDTYRAKVLELVEAKASGRELVVPPTPTETDTVVDLMAALEASVKEARKARSRHPSRGAGSAGDDAAEGDGAEEKAARPARARRARKSA